MAGVDWKGKWRKDQDFERTRERNSTVPVPSPVGFMRPRKVGNSLSVLYINPLSGCRFKKISKSASPVIDIHTVPP